MTRCEILFDWFRDKPNVDDMTAAILTLAQIISDFKYTETTEEKVKVKFP